MSSLGNILLGFKTNLSSLQDENGDPYSFDVLIKDPPPAHESAKNAVYISPGRNITFEERGGNRVYSCEIYVSVVTYQEDRSIDSGSTIKMAQVLEDVLNSVDRDASLQNLMESCLPVESPFFYLDSDQSQGVALQIRYQVAYIKNRNRPRR